MTQPTTNPGSDNTRRWAGLSGIAVVVLFGVGSALWGLHMPHSGAPGAEIIEFYRETADRIVVGASLSLLAIPAFVLFAAAVRHLITDADGDDVLATTVFGGALLGLAAGLGAETINMVGAVRASDGQLTRPLAQSLFEISQVLGSTAAGVGIGVFALATAAAALRTGLILPRWIAIISGIIGVSLLSPVSRINVVSGSALLLLTSIIALPLLRTAAEEPNA